MQWRPLGLGRKEEALNSQNGRGEPTDVRGKVEGCETNGQKGFVNCYSWFLECVGKAERLHSWPALFSPGCPRQSLSQETHEWHARPEIVTVLS